MRLGRNPITLRQTYAAGILQQLCSSDDEVPIARGRHKLFMNFLRYCQFFSDLKNQLKKKTEVFRFRLLFFWFMFSFISLHIVRNQQRWTYFQRQPLLSQWMSRWMSFVPAQSPEHQ